MPQSESVKHIPSTEGGAYFFHLAACAFLFALLMSADAFGQGLEAQACGNERADGRLEAGRRAYGLAWGHSNNRRMREALACFRVSLAVLARELGDFDEATVHSAIGVAMSLRELERSWDAEAYLTERMALAPVSAGNWRGHVQLRHFLATIHAVQKRSLDQERVLFEALEIARRFGGDGDVLATQSLDWMADIYNGRDPARYEALALESLAIQERHRIPNANQYIHRLMALAHSYASTGNSPRLGDAEAALLKALRFAQQRLPTTHRDLAQIHMSLSSHYTIRGQTERAIYHAREEIRIAEAGEGSSSASVSNGIARLAQLLAWNGQLSEALELQQRSCRLTAMHFSYPPVIAACWSNNADDLAKAQQWPAAYATAKMAAAMMRAHQLASLRANDRDGKQLQATGGPPFAYSFLSQIQYGWRVQQPTADIETMARIAGETFEAAQWATRSRAADALNRTAARLSTTSAKLADLARKIETLTPEKDAAEARLVAEYNKGARDGERIASLRADLVRRQQEIDALTMEMIQRFPEYATLSNPAPLSIDAVRSLLRPGEVLVQFLVMNRKDTGILSQDAYAWFVTRKEARWVKIGLDAATLTRKVARLRCGLDPSGWTRDSATRRWIASDPSCKTREAARNAVTELPFETGVAHDLYMQLFGQAADMIDGAHLLIVPSGPLAGLPFHALVTRRNDASASGVDLAELRAAAWLAHTHAVTVLPSVASLAGLRRHVRVPRAAEPFIGWGDPVLAGTPACRSVAAPDPCGDDPRSAEGGAQRGIQAAGNPVQSLADLFRGGIVDLAKVRALCPLPDTANELRCVAKSLGAPLSAIRLGRDATEAAVRSAPLDRFRVVHFATHGLLAGQVRELASIGAEPALVLTPPSDATNNDDGLLTASEIAALKLNADWVILSACNTAAGNTPTDEALSGLARAFLYAGARALLVSHWEVDSTAATRLVTAALRTMSENPRLGRAEAVRRSMIELMGDADPLAAHPRYWAPFIVIGEGGTE